MYRKVNYNDCHCFIIFFSILILVLRGLIKRKNNAISVKTITLFLVICHISGQIDGFAAFPEKHPRACVQNSTRTRNSTRFYLRLSFSSHKLSMSNKLYNYLYGSRYFEFYLYINVISAFHTLSPFYRSYRWQRPNWFFIRYSVDARVSIIIVMITLMSTVMVYNKESLGTLLAK